MRLFLILSASLIVMSSSVQAMTLSCDIKSRTDHGSYDGGRGIPSDVIESWSPKKQVHILNLKMGTAVYKGAEFKTKLDVLNDKTIQWKYIESRSDKNKTTFSPIIFKYHYIRKNHRMVSSVDFGPGYLNIVSFKGRCTEHK